MVNENPSRFVYGPQGTKSPLKGEVASASRQSGVIRHSFTGLRSFSLISLIAIVIAATLMTMGFRYISIADIQQQSETANVIAIEAELAEIMTPPLRRQKEREAASPSPLAEGPQAYLRELEGHSSLRRLILIDSSGRVLFASRAQDRQREFSGDANFLQAMTGKIVTKVAYRDVLNVYIAPSGEENLAHTYYPLRASPSDKVIGAILLSTDISAMAERSALSQALFISTALIIMLMLYFSLLIIVKRIESVIDQQQIELAERSNLLAAVSRRMIDSHEAEKKQVAAELHERIAQTLAAAKMEIEAAMLAYRRGVDPQVALNKLVPVLHAATQDVRHVATEIHPGTLEDFGLVTTLHMRLNEFRERHPHIDVEESLSLTNQDIPSSLNNIVYRVFADALITLTAEEALGRIGVLLEKINGAITLTIRDDSLVLDNEDSPYQSIFDKMQLSGGKFSLVANDEGGLTLSASWLA